ncbi:type II toxin-antitoxin system RelE/ParE family toxin [Ornithobacterium rhinotracheale]
MVLKWSNQAQEELFDILDFWINHNKSDVFSKKILVEINKVEKELINQPYFLSIYYSKNNVYKKNLLNNKFSIYYRINNENIDILHFRDNRQKPLYK